MGEIVELIPKDVIERAVEVRSKDHEVKPGYRLVELARRRKNRQRKQMTQVSRVEEVQPVEDAEVRSMENTEIPSSRPSQIPPPENRGSRAEKAQVGGGADREPQGLSVGGNVRETGTVGKSGPPGSVGESTQGSKIQKDASLTRENSEGSCAQAYRAEECLRVYEVDQGAVVVFWRLEKIDDWMAPVLGAACKELLTQKELKQVVFDFSVVEEMSTAAINTLIRFRNTIVHLEKRMQLVTGPGVRKQLEVALIDRVFDVHENIYFLVGSEIQFLERKKVRGSQAKPGWLACFAEFCQRALFGRAAGSLLALSMIGVGFGRAFVGPPLLALAIMGTAVAQTATQEPFPSLPELERMLIEAPDLRAIKVELERHKLEDGWGNQIFFYSNYSQFFPSFAPFFPLDEFGLGGGTTVGVSVSVTLDRLVGKKRPADLDRELKTLEYERLFQQKLASLRMLFRDRQKLIVELDYLAKQKRTVDLQLEKVQIGLALMPANGANSSNNGNLSSATPFIFDPIDVAEAEERVAKIASEIKQIELDIESVQAEIMGLLGKGQLQP